MGKTVEFRGCDNLVIAAITGDDTTGYTTGAVEVLAPVAEVSKTVESSSETHYYDNTGMIVIQAEGSDTITLTVPALPLGKLATITGKVVDSATGAFIDCPPVEKYFALGYRLKLTDGTYRYVWRLKGSFAIPDETSATEDNGTGTNNQQLTYTGIIFIFLALLSTKGTVSAIFQPSLALYRHRIQSQHLQLTVLQLLAFHLQQQALQLAIQQQLHLQQHLLESLLHSFQAIHALQQ